jgi:predicted metal-dependent hydrolase
MILSNNVECEIEVNKKNIYKCYLRVYPNGKIKVSVPYTFSREKIEKFVQNNKMWIEQKLSMQNKEQKKGIYYLGKEYPLEFIQGKKIASAILDDKIIIQEENDYDYEKIVREFFSKRKEEAKTLFSKIAKDYCTKYIMFRPMPIIIVRSMVSWGLYNKNKNIITLNDKLLQADLENIKMVIFHELCHIKEQNHSKNFYNLLAIEFPNYKLMKKNLNKLNTRFYG